MDDASSSVPPMEGQPPMDNNMNDNMPPMGGEENAPMDEKTQEVMDIAGGLDDKDKDTLLKYARSLKDEQGDSSDNEQMPEGDMPPMGGDMPQQPMQESVIFTKGQLRKINEGLGMTDDEKLEREKPMGKTTRTKSKSIKPTDPPIRK